jgi:hypothetical protein
VNAKWRATSLQDSAQKSQFPQMQCRPLLQIWR